MPLSSFFVRGFVSGASILTGFGTLWALGNQSGLPTGGQGILLVGTAAICTILAVTNIRLWLQAGRLPTSPVPEETTYWEKAGPRFGLVFGAEIALIVVISSVLSRIGHETLIPPAIALIVGLHFLPLARLFHLPIYSATGIAMSLLAVGCLVAVLLGLRLGGLSLFVWSSVVGVGNALILWSTAIYLLSQGYRALPRTQQ